MLLNNVWAETGPFKWQPGAVTPETELFRFRDILEVRRFFFIPVNFHLFRLRDILEERRFFLIPVNFYLFRFRDILEVRRSLLFPVAFYVFRFRDIQRYDASSGRREGCCEICPCAMTLLTGGGCAVAIYVLELYSAFVVRHILWYFHNAGTTGER